jgi:hypothetical protein
LDFERQNYELVLGLLKFGWHWPAQNSQLTCIWRWSGFLWIGKELQCDEAGSFKNLTFWIHFQLSQGRELGGTPWAITQARWCLFAKTSGLRHRLFGPFTFTKVSNTCR